MKKGFFNTLKTAAVALAAGFVMTSAASAATVSYTDYNTFTGGSIGFAVAPSTGIVADLTTVPGYTPVSTDSSFKATVNRFAQTDNADATSSFVDVFKFTTSEKAGLRYTPSVEVANFFADLRFWFTDAANNIISPVVSITDATGDLINDPILTYAQGLLGGQTYFLNVAGTLLKDKGGFYGVEVAAVPLPPAAIAFGSALVGMGLLGRRRKNKGSEVA